MKNIKRYLSMLLLAMVIPANAGAAIRIQAEYHPPTNLFALMDGVSGWAFNDPAYQEAWRRRFGWSERDRHVASGYKRYRDRTFHDPVQKDRRYGARNDGMFAARSSYSADADPLARNFIGAKTIEDALASLEDVASAEDAELLREFYEHFRARWSAILDESRAFAVQAEALNGELQDERVAAYLARTSDFYQVEAQYEFNVRFVWWPPIGRTFADISGQTFLIRSHPQRHARRDDVIEIVMHEAAHYISASQPAEQKRKLTDEFLGTCSASADNDFYLLEEPLAVAWGQAAFAKYGRGKPLDPGENWYRPPIPDIMGRLLWLHIDGLYETDATITDGIIATAAGYCARLLDIGAELERGRP